MNELSREERNHNRKHNEAILYDLGHEQAKKICEETDRLLEEHKDIVIPKSLDEWFYNYLNEQETIEKKRVRKKRFKYIASRAAAVIFIFGIIGGSLTLGVEAFRVKFYNMFIKDVGTHTDLILIEEDNEHKNALPADWNNYYFPTYVPTGFKLESFGKNELNERYYFTNSQKTISILIQNLSEDISIVSQIDTEDTELVETTIHGHNAVYVNKNNSISISWIENDKLFKISGHVSVAEIEEMAESIAFFK